MWDCVSDSEDSSGYERLKDAVDDLRPALAQPEPEGRPAPVPAEGEVAELVEWLRGANWDRQRQTLATRAADLLEQRQAAPVPVLPEGTQVIEPAKHTILAPAPVPVASDTRYEFSVLDADCTEQAGGSAPTYAQALSEGQHYLAQYQQDGPHTLEVRRVEVLHPDALPVLPEGAQVIEPTKHTILVPAPVPVAVSERPWEREGWCDAEGGFWAEHISRSDITSWRYATAADIGGWAVRCLPFNALPLPSGEVEA